MPYPPGIPQMKHKLLRSTISSDNNGSMMKSDSWASSDEFRFTSSSNVLSAIEESVSAAPPSTTEIAVLYSYKDAPSGKPLSRELIVLGVAEMSLSFVRKLIQDDSGSDSMHDCASCLHPCTIAVKRADGSLASQLKPQDVTNSHSFAAFLHDLQRQELVAIVGPPDKYGRFGILKPNEDMTQANSGPDNYQGQDFAATLYVGNVDKVKDFLTGGIPNRDSAQVSAAPETTTEGLWVPPGASGSDYDAGDATDSNTDGLWVPPGADSGNDFGNYDYADTTSSWQPDEQETASESRKRKREEAENGDEFHADKGAAKADEFYSNLTRSLGTRADSRIYHMRSFNGWVKATQIQELDPRTSDSRGPMRVLDLACGKGGDLKKWVLHRRGISNYVGIDVARGSLRDAAVRARGLRHKLTKCTFTCADLGADVPGRLKSSRHKHMQKLLTWSLENDSEPESSSIDPKFYLKRGGGVSAQDHFDVVSIQFAIHYMMSSRKRARRFFRTVSELLAVGGTLIATTIDARLVLEHMMGLGYDLYLDGNAEPAVIEVGGGACRLSFDSKTVKRLFHSSEKDEERYFGLEYTFTLKEGTDHAAGFGDAVNLPEWLCPLPALTELANEAGLELEYVQNFHEFWTKRQESTDNHNSLYNMSVLNRRGTISSEEWEISQLYAALKFRKVREPENELEEDEEDVENAEDDQDVDEIDPVVKAKFMPIAMMKAKKAVGEEVWKSLPGEEKTRLTNIELRKLA